jgi:hypothetical protein
MSIHASPEVLASVSQPREYDSVRVDPCELYNRYSTSEYGRYHATQQLRYAQDNGYRYGNREQFLHDLGPDVHPVEHMLYTHDEITVPLIAEQQAHHRSTRLSENEITELRTAAMLHDLGECTHPAVAAIVGFDPSGDVKYGTHLPDHKTQEKIVRNHIFDLYYNDVPKRLLKRVDQIDLKEVDDYTVRTFEVIERLGYYITASRAANLVMEADGSHIEDEKRIMQLGRLAISVSRNHFSFLNSVANTYPFVERTLGDLNN